MRVAKSCFFFALFILGFLATSVYRFQAFVQPAQRANSAIVWILFFSALSGIALAIALSYLDLFSRAIIKKILYGSVLGVVVFLMFFGFEDMLSDRKLFSKPQALNFADPRGHCGVYIGRTMIRFYRHEVSPTTRNLRRDYTLSNECRADHFRALIKRNKLDCEASEDIVQCLTRWMPAFADGGHWNIFMRSLFYQEVERAWKDAQVLGVDSKIAQSSWLEYAIKDHELNVARPSLLKQAGLEEEFSDESLYYRHLDDYENTALTAKIFQLAANTMGPESPAEGAAVSRFRQTMKEVQFQTEKLPELEKELEELKKRVQL